jgi:hypothetical protein
LSSTLGAAKLGNSQCCSGIQEQCGRRNKSPIILRQAMRAV